MPSSYLAPGDFAAWGVPSSTTPQQVTQASTIIDTHLNRSEGLVWAPDCFGRPAYMAALQPLQTVTLAAPMAAGRNITIAMSFATPDLIGEVFIIDRATPALCEPLTVTAVDPIAGTVTFAQALKAHATGATLEAGLTIVEDRALPAKRSIARVSRPQLAGLISVVGRYSYGRRSDRFDNDLNDLNLLASVAQFGGVPAWSIVDVGQVSVSTITGECWIPPGLLLAYFSEVRLRYVAGFPATAIPPAIKQATASVIANTLASQDSNPIYKVIQAGGTKMERFADTYIDGDTAAALSSYKVRLMV